ncbi:MAG: L-2-amino-thiazoline-4-carboxylic acid hydrolase [Bacteroidota bacterium]
MIQRLRSEISTVLCRRFDDRSAVLVESVEKEFLSLRRDIDFARHSKNPMDRRVVIAGLLLALMKILRKNGCDFEAIRAVSLEIAENLVTPKNRFHLFLKHLKTIVVLQPFVQRLLEKKMQAVRNSVEPQGFSVGYVKGNDNGLLFGIDIHQCGICILFTKHDLGEYATILCEIDYITSAIAGLTLQRTTTIANGGAVCDFRFYRS